MKNILVVFLILSAHLTMAQKGFLRGKITDAENGEALIGATISKQGTTIGAVADFDGNYSLPLNVGTHTIIVQFVSYQTKTIENITIVDGEATTLDIALGSDVAQLAEVVVQAEAIKDNDAALLTLQRKSASVTDGISSQSFKKIGDSNLSGAMKRVTGVAVQGGKYVYVRGLGDRYTRTTLNGLSIPGLNPDRNDVQIDLFPTSVLENVVVYKTFSPELAGDFTGGTVNIETKSFPEEKQTRIGVGIGYNPSMHFNNNFVSYNGSNLDRFGFDDGSRALPIDPQRAVPRITNDTNNELPGLTSKLDPQLASSRQMSFFNHSFSFNHGNQQDKERYTVGYGLVFNYQNNTEFYENADLNSSFFKAEDQSEYALDPQRQTVGDLGSNNTLWSALGSVAFKFNTNELGIRLLRTQNSITQTSDRTMYDIEETGQTIYSDVLTFSQRSITNPTVYGKHQLGDFTVKWSNAFSIARVYDPDFRITDIAEVKQFEAGEETAPVYAIAGGKGGNAARFWRDLNETNENLRIDIEKPLAEDNILKFGAAGLMKWREFNTYAFTLDNNTEIPNDPNYLLQPENIYSPTSETGTYIKGDYQAANNYDARSAVYAAYVLNDIKLNDNLRAIYGLRLEHAAMNFTGQNNMGTLIYNDVQTLNELNLLPSANIVYSLSETSNVRASYGRTLARPSFQEKSIAQVLDPISGLTFSGNIDLNQTNINNFDVRFENYFGRNEMLAISGFYKQFDGHIEKVRFADAVNEITWRNIGGSAVYGLEFEFRKNLNFINGLMIGSNVSLSHSTVDMTEIEVRKNRITGVVTTEYESRVAFAREGQRIDEHRVMAGQAPYLINSYINYTVDEGNLNLNLSYNVQGETLNVIGVGQVPDVYTKPFNSLSFNASKQLGSSLLTLGIDNILNDKKQDVWKGYETEDQVNTNWSVGRTFSLKYAYTF